MNVSLTPELERLVQRKVQSGRYSSASEVVREALRLMEQHDQQRTLNLETVRSSITAGMESLRAGRGVEGESFFDAMEADLSAPHKKATD
jgi:antitoxin ParD1/3/4